MEPTKSCWNGNFQYLVISSTKTLQVHFNFAVSPDIQENLIPKTFYTFTQQTETFLPGWLNHLKPTQKAKGFKLYNFKICRYGCNECWEVLVVCFQVCLKCELWIKLRCMASQSWCYYYVGVLQEWKYRAGDNNIWTLPYKTFFSTFNFEDCVLWLCQSHALSFN